MSTYVTSKEAQQTLCITSATLMNWKNNGKIQYKKIGHKFLYDIDSVDVNIQQNKLDYIIEQNIEILNLLKKISDK